MDPFSKLVDFFMRFPGVGGRQSKRFVYFLLSQDTKTLSEFSEMLLELKRAMFQCEQCYRYFNAEYVPNKVLCSICAGMNTDKTMVMIVEKDVDIESVRRSGAYQGRYFVFGGLVPLVPKKYSPSVRTQELSRELQRAMQEDGLKEIVFGFTASVEGEHTKDIIMKEIEPILEGKTIMITTLGRGFSTGTELEYSDDETFRSAFKNRA